MSRYLYTNTSTLFYAHSFLVVEEMTKLNTFILSNTPGDKGELSKNIKLASLVIAYTAEVFIDQP